MTRELPSGTSAATTPWYKTWFGPFALTRDNEYQFGDVIRVAISPPTDNRRWMVLGYDGENWMTTYLQIKASFKGENLQHWPDLSGFELVERMVP